MSVYTTPPKGIRENLARANSYLKRDDCERALEAGIAAISEYAGVKIIGEAKFGLEVALMEFTSDLCRHHLIRAFFHANRITKEPFIQYARGQERKLIERLEAVLHGLRYMAEEKAKEEENNFLAKREKLYNSGLESLARGELPRGKAYLRRYADDYGKEQGVFADVGNLYLQYKLHTEAAEMFSLAMEEFPNDPKGYIGGIAAYAEIGPSEKVEELYLTVLRKFGPHPKTLLSISKFYLGLRNKEKAWDYARQAYSKDPNLLEAKEIMDKLGY